MDVKLINPFVSAAMQVLEGEVGGPVERGGLRVETSPLAGNDVTALVGLAGAVKGVVMLSMTADVALRIASRMAGEEFTQLTEIAKSAVAELTNMVSGRATISLEQMGYDCNISAPTVVTGSDSEISLTDGQRLVVELHTPAGEVALHVSARLG